MRIAWLVRPVPLLLIPAAISAIIWAAPWGSGVRRGYFERAHLGPSAVVFLLAWYGTWAVFGHAGYLIGRTSRPVALVNSTTDRSYYRYFTGLAILGTAWTYGAVAYRDPGLITGAVRHLQFNLVRKAVPYSAGPATLRYASIAAGSIAIFELVRTRRATPVHLLNVILLALTAALASRLSLVMAVVLLLGLVVHRSPNARIPVRWLIAGLVLFWFATSGLNYVRNAQFYRNVYQVDDPMTMNAYETIAYLGAPFQVSVGVAGQGDDDFPGAGTVASGIAGFLTPSYVASPSGALTDREDSYRSYVDVEPGLTTNSVLSVMYGAIGLWCLALAAAIAAATGFVVGHASRYRSYFFLAGYAAAYCFAEVWRVFLFNAGIVQFLVLAFALLPLVARRGGARTSAADVGGENAQLA